MTQSRSMTLILIFVLSAVLSLSGVTSADEEPDLLTDIDSLASFGDKAHPAFTGTIRERIKQQPEVVTDGLLDKLNDTTVSEQRLATYVWALGLAGLPRSVDELTDLAESTGSELVRGNCLNALANIGGEKAGQHLRRTLDETSDNDMRFNILNLLAQMQYEPALEEALNILEVDPRQFYWQPIFVFGKFGDLGVPLLIERIDASDKNVRRNAINVLGQWLIPLEAARPLQERYWNEGDKEIRHLILSSLEMLAADLSQTQVFFEQVVAEEKDDKLKKFAEETLGSMQMMQMAIDSIQSMKTVSAAEFQNQYSLLYNSAGHDGDYDLLMKSSSAADEPKLKRLRERILVRNSDEAFYDYQAINKILIINRILGS